jgi:hypothetical protein
MSQYFGAVAYKYLPSRMAQSRRCHYLPIDQLLPGQLRYSRLTVSEKVFVQRVKTILNFVPFFILNVVSRILPEAAALPVIKSRFGYVLIDGHHEVLAARQVGLNKLRIRVERDLSDLEPEEFWQQAAKEGLVYPYDKGGGQVFEMPASFDVLKDDPNRHLAAKLARKYHRLGSKWVSRGAEFPVWIKQGNDIPFIELKIADAFYRANFTCTYEMASKPTDELVEKARQILLGDQIEGLKLVKERLFHAQIDLESHLTIEDA